MSWEWGSVVQKEDHSPGTSRTAPAGPVSSSPWCCSKNWRSGTGGAAEPRDEAFDCGGVGAAGLAPASDVALEISEAAYVRVEERVGVCGGEDAVPRDRDPCDRGFRHGRQIEQPTEKGRETSARGSHRASGPWDVWPEFRDTVSGMILSRMDRGKGSISRRWRRSCSVAARRRRVRDRIRRCGRRRGRPRRRRRG